MIDADGNIDLSDKYGGKVKIAGLTLPDADAVLTKHVREFAIRGVIKLSRSTAAATPELEQRVRQLEKEVKELRAAVQELRDKK